MIRNILVIRFRRVGDSVLSMALCHSLKLTFPDAQVHFVINKSIAPLYAGHPDVDRVIPFNDREQHGLTYVKKVWAVVRQTRYDVIIDMRSTPKSLLFSLCSLRSPYRIGRKKWYGTGLLTHRMATPDDADRVWSNLELMKPLAAEAVKLELSEEFRLYVTSEEQQRYNTYLHAQGVDTTRPIVLLAVATRIAHKAWPQDRMEIILRRMTEKYRHMQFVMNYAGEDEKRIATHYYEALGRPANIFINVEARTLRELCALCAASSFFFGNEGGPRHISQAMNVPSFAIYPPGIDKQFWLPGQSERFQGISPDDSVSSETQRGMTYAERMALITVDDVWAGVEDIMDTLEADMSAPEKPMAE